MSQLTEMFRRNLPRAAQVVENGRWRMGRSGRIERGLIERCGELRDRYRGRRCFVIGNGPSLAEQSLAPLSGEVTIVMNAFNRHPILSTGWRPTIHCMAEPAERFQGAAWLARYRECASTAADAHLFAVETQSLVERCGVPAADRVYYVKLRGNAETTPVPRRAELSRPLPRMQNTAHLAILAALHMGCRPIYLLGLDHDWLAHRGLDRHFYGDEPETGMGDYWDLASYPYLELMESTVRVWRDYLWIAGVARRMGVEVYNATSGGFLDVFPRVEYEPLISTRAAG